MPSPQAITGPPLLRHIVMLRRLPGLTTLRRLRIMPTAMLRRLRRLIGLRLRHASTSGAGVTIREAITRTCATAPAAGIESRSIRGATKNRGSLMQGISPA
jgi:hypothetical protein